MKLIYVLSLFPIYLHKLWFDLIKYNYRFKICLTKLPVLLAISFRKYRQDLSNKDSVLY